MDVFSPAVVPCSSRRYKRPLIPEIRGRKLLPGCDLTESFFAYCIFKKQIPRKTSLYFFSP